MAVTGTTPNPASNITSADRTSKAAQTPIAPGSTYTVQQNDTLSSIALRAFPELFKQDRAVWGAIKALNPGKVDGDSRIFYGQGGRSQLQIPTAEQMQLWKSTGSLEAAKESAKPQGVGLGAKDKNDGMVGKTQAGPVNLTGASVPSEANGPTAPGMPMPLAAKGDGAPQELKGLFNKGRTYAEKFQPPANGGESELKQAGDFFQKSHMLDNLTAFDPSLDASKLSPIKDAVKALGSGQVTPEQLKAIDPGALDSALKVMEEKRATVEKAMSDGSLTPEVATNVNSNWMGRPMLQPVDAKELYGNFATVARDLASLKELQANPAAAQASGTENAAAAPSSLQSATLEALQKAKTNGADAKAVDWLSKAVEGFEANKNPLSLAKELVKDKPLYDAVVNKVGPQVLNEVGDSWANPMKEIIEAAKLEMKKPQPGVGASPVAETWKRDQSKVIDVLTQAKSSPQHGEAATFLLDVAQKYYDAMAQGASAPPKYRLDGAKLGSYLQGAEALSGELKSKGVDDQNPLNVILNDLRLAAQRLQAKPAEAKE